jgi:hypothetical protein
MSHPMDPREPIEDDRECECEDSECDCAEQDPDDLNDYRKEMELY